MPNIIDTFTEDPNAAYAVAGLIIVVTILLWFVWVSPALSSLRWHLHNLTGSLRDADNDWPRAIELVEASDTSVATVAAAWCETQRRAVNIPRADVSEFRLLNAPTDLWSPTRLLAQRMNLPLAEAVPNLLVGVGLLFTFAFLTLAIHHAAQVINVPGATAAANTDFVQAASKLLNAAGAKFSTSLAGLFASLIWSIALRRKIAALGRQCDEVLDLLEGMVPSTGVEELMTLQAEQTEKLGRIAEEQTEIAAELLHELRDQTGTLKRFETDMAVSLAGAITSAFAPQMQEMTDRLTGAIHDLSKNLSSINQDALQQMLTEFNTAIKENTAQEMTQFREALVLMSERLDAAGSTIGEGMVSAASNITTAGDNLVGRVDEVAGSLTAGAGNLEAAAQSIKESINDLDDMLGRATEQGDRGVRFLNTILDSGKAVSAQLAAVGTTITATSVLVDKLAGELSETVNGVEELTGEQRTVIAQLKKDAPIAMTAINEVAKQLQEAVVATKTAMDETRKSIAAASTSLNSTVDAINTGVSQYSEQVAKLHSELDENVTKAIGGLGKTTSDLTEVLEEFNESLSMVSQRTK
jgi:predicted  nucleic acid-binding Zn-ribbon protein